jgi:cell division protein FtsI (penicillin-binding protein 3)
MQSVNAPDRSTTVAALAFAAFSVLLLVIVARVAQLQLKPSPELAAQMSQRLAVRTEPALRGDLLDRRGRLLSATRSGYRAFVDPEMLPKPPDEAIVALADATGQDPEKIASDVLKALETNDIRRTLLAEFGSDVPKPKGPLKKLWEKWTGTAEPTVHALTPVADPHAQSTGDADELSSRAGEEPASDERPPALIRFVPVSGSLDETQAAAVRAIKSKIAGVGVERQNVRESPGSIEAAALLGKVGSDPKFTLGIEKKFEQQLSGTPGKLRYTHDAWGRPLWIDPSGITPATPGQDMRLSIDIELQRIVNTELARGVEAYNAAGGRCVLMDPLTGEVLAMADIVRPPKDAKPYPWADAIKRDSRGRAIGPIPKVPPVPPARYIVFTDDPKRVGHASLARNRCVEDIYEPGSTFKPYVWSTITELGLAKPDEVFDTENGMWITSYGRRIPDTVRKATMTWHDVLVNSSNIGMAKAAERLSFKQLRDVCTRFGFGRTTGIGLAGEASGLVTSGKGWSKYTQTSVAFGHEVAVTPVQMARAFCAFARPGELAGTLPPIRLTAAEADDPSLAMIDRVLPAKVARLTKETMSDVAKNMEDRLAASSPGEVNWRYSMFGKSGTAEIPLGKAPEGKRRPPSVSGYYDDQYNCSFVAGAPFEIPRLVIVVVIDDPGPELVRKKMHYGARTAGPVARRILDQSLAYLGIPPDRADPKAELASGTDAPSQDR